MTDHETDRRKHLDHIRALGIDPYTLNGPLWTQAHGLGVLIDPIHLVRSRYNPADCNRDSGPVFTVAGRILLRRGMGKLSFVTLTSQDGNIQLAFDHSRLNENNRVMVKNLDLGDIILATGKLGATQTGEITIWVTEFHLASKALLPPPDKVDGLKDHETRYRNRHTDLWSNPDVMATMRKRSLMVSRMRRHLTESGYLEVETPMMQANAGGAIAKPFKTHHNALDIDLYMRIAPELYLKRLLMGGMDKVFEIGRNFRNEGLSPRHNPEFTSLEAYQAYGNYESMMVLTTELIQACVKEVVGWEMRAEYQGQTIDFGIPWRRVTLFDLVPDGATPQEKHVIYEEKVEHTLMQPTFVTHFPTTAVPLAKESKEFPGYAEMFELVIGGQEIAPGYTENNDPDAQLAAFQQQGGNIDLDFIEAMKSGMPPAGGMGLGVDRLCMILTNQASIRDVILFPLLRPR